MLSDRFQFDRSVKRFGVLILVVMEDALWLEKEDMIG